MAGSTSKATSLYDYAFDEDVMRQLRKFNLTDQDVMIAQMKSGKYKEVMAVGASGKRSVMIALVVSMIFNGAKSLDDFLADVRDYDESLERACESLCAQAMGNQGRSSSRNDSYGGKRKSSNSLSFGGSAEGGRKKKSSRGSTMGAMVSDGRDLDAQLDSYFADSD